MHVCVLSHDDVMLCSLCAVFEKNHTGSRHFLQKRPLPVCDWTKYDVAWLFIAIHCSRWSYSGQMRPLFDQWLQWKAIYGCKTFGVREIRLVNWEISALLLIKRVTITNNSITLKFRGSCLWEICKVNCVYGAETWGNDVENKRNKRHIETLWPENA